VRPGTPLAVALAALILASPAGAAGRCQPRGSKTLAGNAQVRVFSTHHGRYTDVYGCLRSTGRRLRIARNRKPVGDLSQDEIGELLVAGTSVGMVQESFGDIGVDGDEYETVIVVNLARGGRRFRKHVEENDGDLYEGVFSFLLRADGTAAWTLTTQTDKYVEVDVLGRRSRTPTALAFARGIEAGSLRLTSAAVSWRQDGARRSVRVP
jgi:hypothetical protein